MDKEEQIGKIEKMIESKNMSLRVSDVQREIDVVRGRAFAAFYNNEIDISELDTILKALAALERELHENWHDFSDTTKIVTLPKSVHIYYH